MIQLVNAIIIDYAIMCAVELHVVKWTRGGKSPLDVSARNMRSFSLFVSRSGNTRRRSQVSDRQQLCPAALRIRYRRIMCCITLNQLFI